MSFDELAPVIRQRRRRRKVDGRTINAVKEALEAARNDEWRDNEIIKMAAGGASYAAIGRHYNVSRQRATILVERAYTRRLMLKEFRNGKEVEDLARHWTDIYPKREGKRGQPKVAPEGQAQADEADREETRDQG